MYVCVSHALQLLVLRAVVLDCSCAGGELSEELVLAACTLERALCTCARPLYVHGVGELLVLYM